MLHNRIKSIIPHTISLTGTDFQIPVADISFDIPGPTTVITGGMDGDEYTGIRAAYDLAEYYFQKSFPGRIIILPIVNVPGFYDGKSLNPLDNKYPKYVFPGSKKGSATEQLVDWLYSNFIKDASLWIDLHSGALTERMRPFVWGFEARNKKINETTKLILSALDTDLVVYERAPFLSKASRLASKDCIYLVFERGEKGDQKKFEIEQMAKWAKSAINVVHGAKMKPKKVKYFEKVKYYHAPFDGMWIPSNDMGIIEKGMMAGTLQSLDKSKTETIKFKESGEILWMKDSLFARKNDELAVIAMSKRLL